MLTKVTSPKRFTFTFSSTPGLAEVIRNLETRLSGLNRAEIVKLALVEFHHHLEKEDHMMEKAIRLTEEEEESLAEAMKSPSVLVDPSVPGALKKFLDSAKKKYV